MSLPVQHGKRLFVGFTCSVIFLIVFAMLIAYNTEAQSSAINSSLTDNRPFSVTIPTADPIETIRFYKKLGFMISDKEDLGPDAVCMEKTGTPYLLKICHNRFSETGPLTDSVSGLTFRVDDLSACVKDLEAKGVCLGQSTVIDNTMAFASLKDPNGITIELLQQ